MLADIVGKLTSILTEGIQTEAQTVYLLVGIRKILEHQGAKKQFEYLTFHCDWALHSELEGTMAQRILRSFDAAHVLLKVPARYESLPEELRKQVENITRMENFQWELNDFLSSNGMPAVGDWGRFIHLYAKVVEDCPLVMTAKNLTANIDSVTLTVEDAKTQPSEEGVVFRTVWSVMDKTGKPGKIWVAYTFSPTQRPVFVQSGELA